MFAELIIASEAQQDVVEAPHIPVPKKMAHPFDVTTRSFISNRFIFLLEWTLSDFQDINNRNMGISSPA